MNIHVCLKKKMREGLKIGKNGLPFGKTHLLDQSWRYKKQYVSANLTNAQV
jgi:hypothetical protein